MKHDLSVTAILVAIFLLTQVFGLFLIKTDISGVEDVNGTITVQHGDTALGERPQVESSTSFIYIILGVLLGTGLVLIIMRYGKIVIWKAWFFLAVFLSMAVALGVLVNFNLAFFFALILAILKMYKKNFVVHNFTEVLIYSGLAVLVVPLFHGDITWALLLLIVISVYDMYAVWKSKHMVKMAKFQADAKLFAGLVVPYERKKGLKLKIPPGVKLSQKETGVRNAILGGGDIAFPLIFSGIVMESFIAAGFSLQVSFLKAIVISVFATAFILGLFIFAKKSRFYPAMPFVTTGCIIGYLVSLIA